jgi:hypothetical protein
MDPIGLHPPLNQFKNFKNIHSDMCEEKGVKAELMRFLG